MTEVLRKSVTEGDYSPTPQPYLLYIWGYPFQRTQHDLPLWWCRARDERLRATLGWEPLWSGAISKAITKIAALGFTLDDTTKDAEGRKRRSQQLLLSADIGSGWVPFISRVLQDYLLTDNGAFVEIIRAAKASGSRIIGLAHLDGLRCTRTGNVDVPVLYCDLNGKEHYMQAHQVLTFADLADAGQTYHGVGHSAASRCYPTIARQAALNTYLLEKMTGDGLTELAFVQGLMPDQMQNIVATSTAQQTQRGAYYYKGKAVVPVMSDLPLAVTTIPLKNVPDGFNAVELRQQAAQDYANNIGVPVQDLIPLSGQGLGTGTQTLILAEESEGQGLAAFRDQWLYAINEYVLPTSTTFSWANRNDTRDKRMLAEAQAAQATVLSTLVQAQIITPAEAKQIAADQDLIPREMIPEDITPGGDLSSDEKPMADVTDESSALLAQVLARPVPSEVPREA